MVCSRFLNNNSHFSFSALHFRQAQILEFDRQRVAKIAKEFYGNANAYQQIFEANKPMLKHPDKIYPGQVLRIPPL